MVSTTNGKMGFVILGILMIVISLCVVVSVGFLGLIVSVPVWGLGALLVYAFGTSVNKRRKYIKNGKKVMADARWISGMATRWNRGGPFVVYSVTCEYYDEMGELYLYPSDPFQLSLRQIDRLIKSAIASRAPLKFFPWGEWSGPIPIEVYLGQIPVYFLGEKYYVDEQEFLKRVEVYKRVS